jgi:hypothetical protein
MMNNWLAKKLFSLAAWLDWREVVFRSMAVLLIEAVERRVIKPKRKVGRPLGSKDKKPRKRPVRKVQP